MKDNELTTPTVERAVLTRNKSRWLRNTLLAIGLLALIFGMVFYVRPISIVQTVTQMRLWSQGVRSHYVQLGQHRLHYLVAGEGRPVVLVNGLGASSADWGNMIPELKSKGFKVYAPDMLGFGRSDQPDVDYSISLHAGLLKQFLASQQLTRTDLVGWSMGGWIAMHYAAANPQSVRKLVLLDSAGLTLDPANAAALRPKSVEQLAHMMRMLNPNPSPIPTFVAKDMVRIMTARDWVIDRTLKSMTTGKDLMDNRLHELTMPVLIVWGKADLITPFALADILDRQIPHSVLYVAESCGHLAPIACAGEVLPQIINFLQ